MSDYAITEERLRELGEAERTLRWAKGAMQDYIAGRRKDDVFAELFLILTASDESRDPANDPHPLSPGEILARSDGIWKGGTLPTNERTSK